MTSVKIPWAVCQGEVVSATTASARTDAYRKWYQCLKCSEPVAFTRAHKRKLADDNETDVRAFFSHVGKNASCNGGGPMTYVHKATQRALARFRGIVAIGCRQFKALNCECCRFAVVSGVRIECKKVKPFSVDVVLETSLGDVAVEITNTHKTEEKKWDALSEVYGHMLTCEVDASACKVSYDSKFDLLANKCSVQEEGLVLDQDQNVLWLHSRREACDKCLPKELSPKPTAAVAAALEPSCTPSSRSEEFVCDANDESYVCGNRWCRRDGRAPFKDCIFKCSTVDNFKKRKTCAARGHELHSPVWGCVGADGCKHCCPSCGVYCEKKFVLCYDCKHW